MRDVKRNNWMDCLNIFACFLVVLTHCCVLGYYNEEVIPNARWNLTNIINTICSCAVPCFFMISGANLLNYDKRYTTKEFYKKRLLKTVIPLVVWSVIIYILPHVVEFIRTGKFNASLTRFLNLFVINNINHNYWFLWEIIGIYIITPVLKEIVKDENITKLFIIISILYFAIEPLLSNIKAVFYVPLCNIYITYYLLGYYMKDKAKNIEKRKIAYMNIISLALITIKIFFRYLIKTNEDLYILNYISGNDVITLIYSLTIFMDFSLLKTNNEKWNNRFRKLSSLSMGIYLIHYPIILKFIDKTNIDLYSLFLILLVPIIVYIICAIITYIIKKIPTIKYIIP